MHDAALLVHLQDAEGVGLVRGHRSHRHRHVRHLPAVTLHELAVVHLVELVAGEDQGLLPAVRLQVAQALPDGVGRALVPVRIVLRLLRGQDGHESGREQVELVGEADVFVQALRVELGEDEHPAQARIQAVADGDVDQPVFARDGDRGLGALQREREQARSPSAAEDDAEDVVHEGSPG
jgi:hypothetical protein